ncbi:hypothetical protein EV652_105396 [Kribbella steppae]|uniref:Uncharacterized protein n=1 Tax=Kribbella steppae TaxID=2512223 RepID=A0A4R2HL68_9ACTN|nr:hypothetical protein [Kribbella steppae]TCO30402.1 hypothetical protein EV652_105396 [Kribbella steppae]
MSGPSVVTFRSAAQVTLACCGSIVRVRTFVAVMSSRFATGALTGAGLVR